MRQLKQNYPILIIKLLILSLFIGSIINGYQRSADYLSFAIGSDNMVQDYLLTLTRTAHFRPSIILMIPTIGVFINNKIGWILITAYFYFLLSNLFFSIEKDMASIFLLVIVFPIILLVIFLMNQLKIRNLIYRIPRKSLINMNIIAAIIGLTITTSLFFIKTG